jgi:hypothetical protein
MAIGKGLVSEKPSQFFEKYEEGIWYAIFNNACA